MSRINRRIKQLKEASASYQGLSKKRTFLEEQFQVATEQVDEAREELHAARQALVDAVEEEG